MMKPVNFTPVDSELLLWRKEKSPLFGVFKDGSSAKIWLQKPFLIPWAAAGLTLALSWIFPFLNNRYAVVQISNLEFEHSQFLQLKARISAAEQTFDQQKSDIRDFSALFTSAAHAYPFTFSLQRSIPAQVNLNSFVLDSSEFNVCAFGPDFKSLEDLIDLFKAMPSVDPNSVRFTNIAADPSAWVHRQTAKACLHFNQFQLSLLVHLKDLTLRSYKRFIMPPLIMGNTINLSFTTHCFKR